MLSDCNLMGFRKRSQYCINIQKPHPQPLPVGEGSEYPHFLLENRARRPCSTIVSLANLSRTVVSVPRPPAPKINSPTPNRSPLERGVNTLTSCWRTGHGDHRPTLRVHLRPICYLCLPLYTFTLARNTYNVCAHKRPCIM